MHKTPPGPVVEEVCAAEITHLWRAGERLIPLTHRRWADLAGARSILSVAPAKAGVKGERLDF